MVNPMKMNEREIKSLLNFCEETAIKAAKKLLTYQRKIKNLKVESKDAAGVASDADLASEKIIINEIKKQYPEASILAEEDAFKKYGNSNEAYKHFSKEKFCFVIDPLDGTHNYLASMDYFAICIGFVSQGKCIFGMIYRPSTDDCYFAIKGKGAFKKKLLSKSTKKKLFYKKAPNNLKSSMLVTGFATEKGVMLDREFTVFKNMMGRCRGIRRMGSAALDLCLVAEGVFDGFWERGLAPWDVAAASLICQEAGVKVSDYSNASFHPFRETILAARNPLHKDLLKHMTIA